MNYKIYKIYSEDEKEKCYIGSTKQKYISQRFQVHKHHHKIGRKNGKLGELLNKENVKIELVENLGDISKEECRLKENEYIKKLGYYNCFNAITTNDIKNEQKNIYYKNNRESILLSNKKSREKNKDKVIENKKK